VVKGRVEPRHEALRAVQDTHPDSYSWSTFICLGDDRPVIQKEGV
jgi:hypothetical protein